MYQFRKALIRILERFGTTPLSLKIHYTLLMVDINMEKMENLCSYIRIIEENGKRRNVS